MKTSIFDKIAVLLAWALVQTVVSIAFSYIYKECSNPLTTLSVFIANTGVCYLWGMKMWKETRKVFGFEK